MSTAPRPSKAHIWVNCAASEILREKYPEIKVENKIREEGIAGHWVINRKILGEYEVKEGDIAPNEIEITQYMIDCADNAIEIFESWGCRYDVERLIKIPDFQLEGTPDCYSIDYDKKLIRIFDYKFGFRIVEPFENWQMICYASGILSKIMDEYNWTIEFIIHQPRIAHSEGVTRVWIVESDLLEPYFEKIKLALKKIRSGKLITNLGSHCEYCPVRRVCPTLQESAMNYVENSYSIIPYELSTNEASFELSEIEKAMEILDSRKTGLEEQITHSIKVNHDISSLYQLDRVKKREVWRDGAENEIITIGELLGKNLKKPSEAITPAQCRKLKLDESIIKQYSITPQGELKLVKRSTTLTQKLFGK